MEIVTRITFGQGGSAQAQIEHGFSAPEDGFAWSEGVGSRLRLDLPAGDAAACYLLEMVLNPFVGGTLAEQRLVVRANGVVIGDERLRGEGTVGYRIPPRALWADGGLTLELGHPDAASPASLGLGEDGRMLGFMVFSLTVFRVPPPPPAAITALPPLAIPAPRDAMGAAVRAATGLDPRGLVLCFEAIGHNCEFGLVQEHVGADPLGLLRFAGITLDHLLAGLRTGFAGAGEAVVVRAWPLAGADGRHEFLVYDDRYHIGLHTFRTTDETTAEAVQAEHARRLRFMQRRFARWLRTGQRLFVFQRVGQISASQARSLLVRLQHFGPNALLYVDQDPGLPSGAVEQLEHGLFHGKLARLAPPDDVGDSDLPGWLSVCANAWRLWQPIRPR